MEKWWCNSMFSNEKFEHRYRLSKSMGSLNAVGHTGGSEEPILNDTEKNIPSWSDSSFSNVYYLFDIRDIWRSISDNTFLVRDSQGNSYSVYFDIENQIFEIDNDSFFLNELESVFSGFFNSRSKSKNHYYYHSMDDTPSSWNNHIHSCINSYLHCEVSINDSIFVGTDNYSDSYTYSFVCTESISVSENGNSNITKDFGHLWVQCEYCYGLNYKKFFRSKMNICEVCGYHLKMSSSDRIELLLDPDTWESMDQDMASMDPNAWDSMDPIDSMDHIELEEEEELNQPDFDTKNTTGDFMDPIKDLNPKKNTNNIVYKSKIKACNKACNCNKELNPNAEIKKTTSTLDSMDMDTDTDRTFDSIAMDSSDPSTCGSMDKDTKSSDSKSMDTDTDAIDDRTFYSISMDSSDPNTFGSMAEDMAAMDPDTWEKDLDSMDPNNWDSMDTDKAMDSTDPRTWESIDRTWESIDRTWESIDKGIYSTDDSTCDSMDQEMASMAKEACGSRDQDVAPMDPNALDFMDQNMAPMDDPNALDFMDQNMASMDHIELEEEEEPYMDRIHSYQVETGLTEAVQTGIGQLSGIPIAIGVMDFQFMGGSMGSVVGEKITRLIEYATNRSLPLIIVCASGGARMQEGSLSLMQMAKISSASSNYQSNKKLFYVSILTSPTTGGVTASFGMLGDVIIAEPNATIAFAGKRVIEQTLNIIVPEGSQEAEYSFEKGLFDLIVPRNPLKGVLSELFQLHGFFPLNKKNISKENRS